MIPGFGKQSISIGSGQNCDVRLGGPSVAPLHATIVHKGGGQLVFVDAGAGPSRAGGDVVPANGERVFDFRTPFVVGDATSVPLTHPAYALMLMSRGQAAVEPGSLTLGRDPARSQIVLSHPSISGRHATITAHPLSVTDHQSTSGSYVDHERVAANARQTLQPGSVVTLGPVPLPSTLLDSLLAELAPGGAPAPAPVLNLPSADATAALAASDVSAGVPSGPRRHKTVVGALRLDDKNEVTKTIGRTPDNDIQISHAQVSSKHALLHKQGNDLFLEDRGSQNGTFVRGERIAPGKRVPVQHGEKVFIGPMPLLLSAEEREVAVVIEDSESWEGRPLYEIEAWDLLMEVPDRDNAGHSKVLLDHVSFKALPGDFIALMGPSGAGKTTLLLTLNGYLPPTGGQVRINGEDLYSIYDVLRGSIGYVPQDDIVHPELTVWEAVRYSARFRLPPDYSDEEIDRRVSTTLSQLDLDGVKHLQIGRPEKKVLSGGQRKRVNIAMELVTDPVIMFLDEPTSGLAADDTSALVALLAGLARQTGKTIIATIHQPAKDEFEKFNLALILGQGGVPIFFGPTAPDAYRFFGSWLERQGKPNRIDNPRDMFDMLKQREAPIWQAMRTQDPSVNRAQARHNAAREWHAEFFQDQNPTFQAMYSGRRQVGAGSPGSALPARRPSTSGQFGLLLGRYLKIKSRDVAGTAIMLLQAPIIGVLLALVFGGMKESIPYWCLGALQELSTRSGSATNENSLLSGMQQTSDHSGAIFFLVVSAVWFGTSNAAREIVSERAIYLRERMVNLGLFNYVVSKFVLLCLVTVIQCSVLLAIVFFALGFEGGLPAFGIGLMTLIVTAMNSVAIGLLLSAVVQSGEAAMALTPIALIPQVVLGGLMVPMTTNPMLEWPMYLMPARWGFQGVIAQERLAVRDASAWVIDLQRPELNDVTNFIAGGKFRCAEAQIASDSLNGAWGFVDYQLTWLPPAVLASMMVAVLLVILLILRQRDRV
jgi:ABC-type multidrug transport system ATPase subunit/pSer/pThr/pTyr-binding forkhead associated (FHA) protein